MLKFTDFILKLGEGVLEKERIFYHRAYKKIHTTDTALATFVKFLVLVIPFDFVIIRFHPEITNIIALCVRFLLLKIGYSPETVIATWPFLYKEVYILDLPSVYPTTAFSVLILILSILIPLVALRIKRLPKSLAIWIAFVCFTNLLSAAFFLLLPSKFPHTIYTFSDLYMKTEIGMWIFIPVILAIALTPLPSSMLEKFSLVLIVEAYSIVFGTLRYAIFLIVLEKFSFLFMAMLFFNFGPFFDFVYVVGFYALYLRGLTKRLATDMERWKWLF